MHVVVKLIHVLTTSSLIYILYSCIQLERQRKMKLSKSKNPATIDDPWVALIKLLKEANQNSIP